MNKIDSFENEYFFLSNYYETLIDYDGLTYESSEAAYQSAKVRDKRIRKIFTTLSADISKKLGRYLILREDWEDIKLTVMEDILRIKFSNPKLKVALLSTGTAELIESNWWNDQFWGVCNGVGENHLGKLLMKIRSELSRATKEGFDVSQLSETEKYLGDTIVDSILNGVDYDRWDKMCVKTTTNGGKL